LLLQGALHALIVPLLGLVGRVKWENSVADQPRAVYADVRPVSHSLLRSGAYRARQAQDTHRVYALSGEPAKAKTAYQDFFALWRDADPDIPILKEAKAEYAKLQ
jgi:hypothetical protein